MGAGAVGALEAREEGIITEARRMEMSVTATLPLGQPILSTSPDMTPTRSPPGIHKALSHRNPSLASKATGTMA